jgi:hypothetical protein
MKTLNTETLVYTCFSIPMREHEFEQAEAIIDEISDQYEDVWNVEVDVYKGSSCIVLSHEDEPCDLGVLIKLTQAIVDSLKITEPVTILWTGESGYQGGKITIRNNMQPEEFIPELEVTK